jgi:hypothetical protein
MDREKGTEAIFLFSFSGKCFRPLFFLNETQAVAALLIGEIHYGHRCIS